MMLQCAKYLSLIFPAHVKFRISCCTVLSQHVYKKVLETSVQTCYNMTSLLFLDYIMSTFVLFIFCKTSVPLIKLAKSFCLRMGDILNDSNVVCVAWKFTTCRPNNTDVYR